jgi:sterol desaturase/sphingolipid hydroxylase (fatty acid hydroxylase superfamily)
VLVWLVRGAQVGLLYAWLKLWQSMESHSGYVLPFPLSPWSVIDLMENGRESGQPGAHSAAGRHEFHHSRNDGNYGGVFGFWDRVMGTDAAFDKWRAHRDEVGVVASMPPIYKPKSSSE